MRTMAGQVEIIQGDDKTDVQQRVNAFNEEHLVFATQSHVNTISVRDVKMLYTFVVFHNGKKRAQKN